MPEARKYQITRTIVYTDITASGAAEALEKLEGRIGRIVNTEIKDITPGAVK